MEKINRMKTNLRTVLEVGEEVGSLQKIHPFSYFSFFFLYHEIRNSVVILGSCNYGLFFVGYNFPEKWWWSQETATAVFDSLGKSMSRVTSSSTEVTETCIVLPCEII